MADIKLPRIDKKREYSKREMDRLIDQINKLIEVVEKKLSEVS